MIDVFYRVMYLLGYIPKDNRLYLGDKELNVNSYSLLLSVLEYQTAVMRRDFETADKVLPTIPREQRTRVAHFLEKQVSFIFLKNFYFISLICLLVEHNHSLTIKYKQASCLFFVNSCNATHAYMHFW